LKAVFTDPSTLLRELVQVANRAPNHLPCGQFWEEGYGVVPVPFPVGRADDAKISMRIQPNNHVGDRIRTSKGADGNFPVIAAVTRRLGAQPDGFGILAAVPGGKFKSLGGMKAAFPALLASLPCCECLLMQIAFGVASGRSSIASDPRLACDRCVCRWTALRKWMGLREARLRGIEAD